MDLVYGDDLDEFASETDDEMSLLVQDLEHRLIEEYGSNPDDEDRGCSLLSRLSGTDDPIMIARSIEADFHKDPRVNTCEVFLTRGSGGNEGVVGHLDITVTTDDGLLQLGYDVGVDGALIGGAK